MLIAVIEIGIRLAELGHGIFQTFILQGEGLVRSAKGEAMPKGLGAMGVAQHPVDTRHSIGAAFPDPFGHAATFAGDIAIGLAGFS